MSRSTFARLISTKDTLSIGSIRSSHSRDLLAFPLSMIFINSQHALLREDTQVSSANSTTITILAFFAGAILMFAFAKPESIDGGAKTSATLAIAGLLPWVLLPQGAGSLASFAVMMIGAGGCLTASTFSFVFTLNNAERFVGSAAMTLFIGWIRLLRPAFDNPAASRITVAAIVISMSVCVLQCQSLDHKQPDDENHSPDPSLKLALFILFSYFAIRITGFYAPALERATLTDWPGPASIFVVFALILFQMIFQRSLWLMCCIFYLASIFSFVAWYAQYPQIATFLSEIKEIGLLLAFYLLGCVQNKFFSFKTHKKLIITCLATIVAMFLAIEAFQHWSGSTQSLAGITASILFASFLILSPAFSKHLFFANWSKELTQVNMEANNPDEDKPRNADPETPKQPKSAVLSDYPLSPRERQVAQCLLHGFTLKQTASELGLTTSTVTTYTRSMYKKLNINSRSELFLLFSDVRTDDQDA